MAESIRSLAALKRRIASLESVPAARGRARVATGHGAVDAALGGGLPTGRVHELFGDVEEEGAVAGLALGLTQLLAKGAAPLLWLRTEAGQRAGGQLYGPGLAAMGLDPARLLVGVMKDEAMLLRASVDALRCPGLGALVIELRGRAPLMDLTASRRLALAAEESGVTALLLRIGGDPVPSAAETRWRVAAAPSLPLPGNAPGMSAFSLHLLRRRSGPDGMTWRLAWNSARGDFGEECDERHEHGQGSGGRAEEAALPGTVVPLPAGRPAADRAA